MKGIDCPDLLFVLQNIVRENTHTNQFDFEYDVDRIQQAALSGKAADRRMFWLSRPYGTVCVPARDVFLKETFAHINWTHYEFQSAEIRALALEIGGMEGDRVTGTVYELDYSRHVEVVKKEALHVHNVSVTFEDGYTQVFPYGEFEQGDEVADLECVYGALKDVNFLAQDRRKLEQLLAANFPLPRQSAKRHNRDLTHRR